MTEKQLQAFNTSFRAIQTKFDDAKRRAVEVAARARTVVGPHGVILDAETFEPLRAATEKEVKASVAQSSESDPVGPIMIEGREVFAVPSSMLAD